MADPLFPYPSGVYGGSSGPPDTLGQDTNPGDDPSWLSAAYIEMSSAWQPINVCVGGTQAFREDAAVLLAQEPREDEQAWQRRVSRAVFSPFLQRLADQAAGLLMRKPIIFQSKEEGGIVDPLGGGLSSRR